MALLPTPEQLAGLDPNDHITKDYRHELARMGRANLYFFARYIFGRTGLNERAHLPLCNEAQKIIVTPNALGVFEDPRATGKSNAITIPGPAWCLVQDPKECKRKGWLPLGPEENYMVASYKTEIAAIFTNDTRTEMSRNPLFAWLYGDIIPEFAGSKGTNETWAKEKFTVVRRSGTGYSVMAIGTESGATSLHPRVLFIDDLVNEINYKSASEVAAQVNWMDHSNNLTDIMFGSRIVTQNSWTERDVNFSLREKNKSAPRSVFFFSRSRIVCDLCESGRKLDEAGNPVPCGTGWEHPLPARPLLDHYVSDRSDPPRPYTKADVDALKARLPAAIWWSQHENNPLAQAELKWRESWLRYYTLETRLETGDSLHAVLVTGQGGVIGPNKIDPNRLVYVPISSMGVIVSLDPGLHRPGIAAVGRVRVDSLGDMMFILDCSTDPLSPRDQFFLIFDWVLKWGARRIAFERVGLQNYIQQTIPAMAESYEKERGRTLPFWIKKPNPEANRIVGVQVYKREGDKSARIEASISPFAEQRLIAVRRDCGAFIDEYTIFDKGKYMDALDSVAMTIKASDGLRAMTDSERTQHRLAGRKAIEIYKEANRGAIGYAEGV